MGKRPQVQKGLPAAFCGVADVTENRHPFSPDSAPIQARFSLGKLKELFGEWKIKPPKEAGGM